MTTLRSVAMIFPSSVALSIGADRLAYGAARARDLAFSAVLELWGKRRSEGMTQTEFAEKLGRDTGWLSKKLKGPTNWTLKTLGQMVEALDGELEIRIHDLRQPLQEKANFDAYAVREDRSFSSQGGIDRRPLPGSNSELKALR